MKRKLIISISILFIYVLFTISLLFIDRRPIGPNDSIVGYASINGWFHELTGVNWVLYNITDWGGIIPIVIGMLFGLLGLVEWIKRRSIKRVDKNLFVLGGLYILVFIIYLLFEFMVINRRPVLINGYLEASYPSSTTFLSITFMGSLIYQIKYYIKNNKLKYTLIIIVWVYMLFLVIGRLFSQVHWLTDIIGSIILGSGLVLLYECIINMLYYNKQ